MIGGLQCAGRGRSGCRAPTESYVNPQKHSRWSRSRRRRRDEIAERHGTDRSHDCPSLRTQSEEHPLPCSPARTTRVSEADVRQQIPAREVECPGTWWTVDRAARTSFVILARPDALPGVSFGTCVGSNSKKERSCVEEVQVDDRAEASGRPRRQTEQRCSRAAGEADSRWKIDGDEKADLLGPDQRQTEQPDPRAREGRGAAQDSQAGAKGRRRADRDENADRLEAAQRQTRQHVFRAGIKRSATHENHGGAGDHSKSSLEVDRDDRAERSEPAGRQMTQQEPHAEDGPELHQSGHGQESQLHASRLAFAPRHELPKATMPLNPEASTTALDTGVEFGEILLGGGINALSHRSQVWSAQIQRAIGASSGCLGKGERWSGNDTYSRGAERAQPKCLCRCRSLVATRKHLSHHNDLQKNTVHLPSLRTPLEFLLHARPCHKSSPH